jgi:AMP deaminase
MDDSFSRRQPSYLYSALGPPDPIDYLRRRPSTASTSATTTRRGGGGGGSSSAAGADALGRYDSDDDEDYGDYCGNDDDVLQDLLKDAGIGEGGGGGGGEAHDAEGTSADAHRGDEEGTVRQDPPARERPTTGSAWPYRETLSFTRGLIFYGAGSITAESQRACRSIVKARRLRQKYYGGMGCHVRGPGAGGDDPTPLRNPNLQFRIGVDGVAELYLPGSDDDGHSLVTVPTVEAFGRDYTRLVEMVSEGSMRSYCFQRLQMLSTSFKMHNTINASVEREEQSNLLGTDFYRTMKIDNHIHAAAAPTAKTFVEFVRRKLETEGRTEVVPGQTLRQAFRDAGLDTEHLTIDAFNVLADYSVYQRFDQFNQKYSPFALADMRRIFLKTTNHIDGRYFAELLKIVINRHELSKGHVSACEMRLSIYGMERHEWLDLSRWILRDWRTEECPGPMVSTHNRWLVQIPRLWRIYSKKPVEPGQPPRSFLEMIENVFVPLFEATLRPDDHPEVARAMAHIVGFDSVDDEGALEENCASQRPGEWTTDKNPSFWWQLYFLWANMEVLNRLRRARGLNTFAFRPHAGETGDPMHLAATYLLCQSVNHGILLDMQVSLQYLYYLDQIGLSISPLSNNFLFRKIAENPFPKFFRRCVPI